MIFGNAACALASNLASRGACPALKPMRAERIALPRAILWWGKGAAGEQ
jgi:hypothetical protein